MKEYQNYLFDLYGTLVDIHTDEDGLRLWKRMSVFLGMNGVKIQPEDLHQRYLQEVTREELEARTQRGSGAEIDIASVFESFYPVNSNKHDIEYVAKVFRMLSLHKLHLFPGVPELMRRLKEQGKRLYLLSNAQALFTLPEIKSLDLEQYFDGIVISSCEGYKKPSKEFYEIALKRYNLDPDDTVMIGNDDRADCWGAAEVGLDSMYIFTEQSPKRANPLPPNCRVLQCISDVF